MPNSASQTFLRELDKKLCTAADKLRSNLDATVYKHAEAKIEAQLRDAKNDFYTKPADHKSVGRYEETIHQELVELDYYIEKNVFWVPALSRCGRHLAGFRQASGRDGNPQGVLASRQPV